MDSMKLKPDAETAATLMAVALLFLALIYIVWTIPLPSSL
jgi:hypothetical protein